MRVCAKPLNRAGPGLNQEQRSDQRRRCALSSNVRKTRLKPAIDRGANTVLAPQKLSPRSRSKIERTFEIDADPSSSSARTRRCRAES